MINHVIYFGLTFTTQSQLVECKFGRVYKTFFYCYFEGGIESIDFILSGISFHILGVKYDNDSVSLNTNFPGLV